MGIFDVGRVCLKIAGRDANKKCVVVDVKDDTTVLIDGETRRRYANLRHLEPLAQTLDVKKGASRDEVKQAFTTLGIELVDTKPKKVAARPARTRTVKEKPAEVPAKKAKKAPKAVPVKASPE
jgi:large subunit ribosomal protein L14e